MLIGLTYDLRDDYRDLGLPEEALAEFDSPETVAALQAALERAGHATDRIGNIRALAERLVAGHRWDLVFNIAEGLSGRSREAQVPALLEAFGVPYTFSDPLTQALGLDKAMAKQVVRDAGVPTAPFAVFETASDALDCGLTFPLFLKPVAEGTGKGCERASKVMDHDEAVTATLDLVARFRQPVLAEAFLPGREFTVGILGNGKGASVIGVVEITLLATAEAEIYSFENKELCEDRVLYQMAADAEAQEAGRIALAAYRALGCRDAARIDIRSDAHGNPHFLEVNTLAGMHPSHSDLPILAAKTGMTYDALVAGIVEAAVLRQGLAEDVRRAAS
ncbi:D-alanine--D-alanine ligase [Ruegeria sediminis]|uniref:D-alanine--D-alanine ligase n=1 Tax=Ruegeria sediminis TaxID=2583820 RepID=A0ABY2WVA3_9RHOB|nr:D-alanine--D-alanine ligase [Ruegeria sediminis]TMV05626.1 D-alanine--D-alanine ligase [Ruegeria sediminis]